MCNKGGSPPVPNQTSTAYQAATGPSSFVQPYYQNFISNASNLAQTPFNPAMMGSVAPINPAQTAAGTQLYNLGLDAENFGTTMGNFDPAQVRAIESPYTEDVVNATQNWFNNQNTIQGTDLLSQAIRSGNAFGGDRSGIAEAQLAGQQQLAQAPVIAGLRQAGYTQALDEYNRLKTMGLAGRQFGLQGAQAALGWGTMAQQQQQREMDVAQQNAMMSSAYPFQTQNWYGATLGGLGPLLGSFAQGYTTPPQPNELTQGLGIATSLAGLGRSIFGKHGGPVERRQVGGLVPMVPLIRSYYSGGWAPAPRLRIGGLVMMAPQRRQYGGNISLGSSDDDDSDTSTQVSTKQPSGFNIPQLNIPIVHPPSEAGQMMSRLMSQQRQREQQQQKQQGDNPTANAIDSLAKVAVKAAPLFALLESGGTVHPVRYYRQDGGSTNDDDEDDDNTEESETEDTTAPAPSPTTVATTAPATTTAEPAAPGEPDLSGGYDVPPGTTPAGRPAAPARTAYAQAGPGGERIIPGLGPRPRSFAERWAADPLTQAGAAMLMSRSPYFGPGVGAGILAASGAIETQRKQDLLENKPQLIDDGKNLYYRTGNKITPLGLPSPKAGRQEAIESRQERIQRLKGEQAMELEKQRYPQGRGGARGGRDYTDQTINAMIKQELDASKDATGRPSITADEAEYNAKQRWNARHPDRAFELPPRPAPKPPRLAPEVEDTRTTWERLSPWGPPDPNSLEQRRKRAQTGAAAAAEAAPAAPAQQQQQPQQQARPTDPVQGMRDYVARGGQAARDQLIAQGRQAIANAKDPAQARAQVRQRLKDAGIEVPEDL